MEILFGYINTQGKTVISCKYLYAESFSDDLALVNERKQNSGHGTVFIDTSGNTAISPAFHHAADYDTYTSFSDGLSKVKSDGKIGYMDRSGNLVIDFQFIRGEPFVNNHAVVFYQKEGNNYYGYIDKKGSIIAEFGSVNRCNNFSENHAVVDFGNNKFAILDVNKKPKELDSFNFIGYTFSEGLIHFEKNSKWGFVDYEGNIVIDPQYDYVENFREGLAFFKNGKTTGFIDKSGKIAMEIPSQYKISSNRYFKEGVACIRGNTDKGKAGLIDKNGKIIIEPRYYNDLEFSDGLSPAESMPGTFNYINMKGEKIIAAGYESASVFHKTLARVGKYNF